MRPRVEAPTPSSGNTGAVPLPIQRRGGSTKVTPPLPFEKLWRPLLEAERGPEKGEAILSLARAEYEALCRIHGEVTEGGLRRHLLGNILPQLAVYRVLRREEGEGRALQCVRRLHFATLAGVKRQHEWAAAIPGVFGFYRLLVPWMLRFQHPASGWMIEWVENSRRRISARVHRCFYQDTLERLGAGELIHVYCAGDDYVFGEARSRRIAWTREKTRPQGDAYCDVSFESPIHHGSTR